jgi:hypothetical protein
MNEQPQQPKQQPKQGRRAAFGLAAVLAATALTGGAALTGLTRHAPANAATPVVQQQQAPAPQVAGDWEGGD